MKTALKSKQVLISATAFGLSSFALGKVLFGSFLNSEL